MARQRPSRPFHWALRVIVVTIFSLRLFLLLICVCTSILVGNLSLLRLLLLRFFFSRLIARAASTGTCQRPRTRIIRMRRPTCKCQRSSTFGTLRHEDVAQPPRFLVDPPEELEGRHAGQVGYSVRRRRPRGDAFVVIAVVASWVEGTLALPAAPAAAGARGGAGGRQRQAGLEGHANQQETGK